jgi:negative regulator of flagellin synthesis FlgM
MTIERLGPIDPIQKFNKTQKSSKPVDASEKDSIAFSDEAKLKAQLYKVSEEVNKTEDVRSDRVAEVKKKLEDPAYIDDKVLGTVADRIMDVFGI